MAPPAIRLSRMAAANPVFDGRDPGQSDRERRGEDGGQSDRRPEALLVSLEAIDRPLDDRDGVLHHIDEDEGEDADGEEGEPDPGPRAHVLCPPERESEEDREARDGSEQ